MSAAPITLPVPVHPDTLLLASDDFDPDEAPFEVADNVWADRYFWVHQTVERYYRELGKTDPATWPGIYEHGELIIGEMAETMFGAGAAEDPNCRSAAWDVIVVIALEDSARLAIDLFDRRWIVAFEDAKAKWNFRAHRLPEYVARLTDGWPDEFQRQSGRVA